MNLNRSVYSNMSTLPTPMRTLDDEQRAAAEAPEGPVIILGGAGAGKTDTLVARIAALLRNRVPPHTICCLSTSSVGADDITRRLSRLPQDGEDIRRLSTHISEDERRRVQLLRRIAERAQGIYVGTLHQHAAHYLRTVGADDLRISPHFTIWDDRQAKGCIAECARELPGVGRPSARDIDEIFRWYTLNRSQGPVDLELPAQAGFWHELIGLYGAAKRSQGVLDRDDLIAMTTRSLDQNRDLREVWNGTFTRHLLVDTFQDITSRQYGMLGLLVGPTRSVTIATDPDQSICMEQGARRDLVNRFWEDHRQDPNRASIHWLLSNHRGSETLSQVATTLVDHLKARGGNRLAAGPSGGPKPVLLEIEGPPQLMYHVVLDTARQMGDPGYILKPMDPPAWAGAYAWEDIAVIFPRGHSIPEMLGGLFSRRIPFQMLGDTGLVLDGDGRRIAALLTCLLNPWDLNAFSVAAATDARSGPNGLDSRVIRQILGISRDQDIDLVQAAERHVIRTNERSALHRDLSYLVSAVRSLGEMLEEPEVGLPDLCRRAHGLLVDARGDTGRPTPEPQMARLLTLSESTPRRPNDKLIGHLARFLDLLSPALHPYRRPLENDRVSGGHRGMTLTTIEAARGLQWKVVFVMDASDHVMPGNLGPDDGEKWEQQQRAFYVATTRAAERLFYVFSQQSGRGHDARPSRMLEVLGDQLVHEVLEPVPRPRHEQAPGQWQTV